MASLTEFLQAARVHPEVAAYITETMQLKSVADFARRWTSAEYERGVQSDVVVKIAAFKDAARPEGRIAVARLRAAWVAAQGQASARRPPEAATGKRFVWVSGKSCAGKSSVSDLLKGHGFVAYEGDVWCIGGDPIAEPNLSATPELLRSRDPEMAKAVTEAIQVGRTKLGEGQSVPWKVWEDFYTLMLDDIVHRCGSRPEQNFVISFAVYQRSERDLIRERLGSSVSFLLLDVPEELLEERIFERTLRRAEAEGKTLEQYFHAFHPGKTADQVFAGFRRRRAGFQALQPHEPRTAQLRVARAMRAEDVAAAAVRLLGLDGGPAAAPGARLLEELGDFPGVWKWNGCAALPDGRLICAPFDHESALLLSPGTAGAVTCELLGRFGGGHAKWSGCAVLADGRAVFCPANGSSILLFDPASKSFEEVGRFEGEKKWSGCTALPDGRVLFVPGHHASILLFDPLKRTWAEVGNFQGKDKWSGHALLPDGRVLFVPFDWPSVLLFNPASHTWEEFGRFEGRKKWSGCSVLPDGSVVFVPGMSRSILIFDPVSKAWFEEGCFEDAFKWNGCVALKDGRVAFVPSCGTSILFFDPNPAHRTRQEVAHLAAQFQWSGGAMLPDGRAALVPCKSRSVLLVDPTLVPSSGA